MRSVPGEYHGFFWFFFFNEHLFRFLDMRHPRDYNTVPRALFWLFHLLWLFPWSVYLPAAFRSGFRPAGRAGRVRLLCLCWTGFLLLFFTFSTTQEYYSMPCYPALALLIGGALATGGGWIRVGSNAIAVICILAAVTCTALWWQVRHLPTPGDISQALTSNPEVYTLSLGHMTDLTLRAFAYLRPPLLLAALAFTIGAVGQARGLRRALSPPIALVVMMILFTHAARLAMVSFDPYLSSRPLANTLLEAPPGQVIVDNQYYAFSSVFFYAGLDRAWLLNGRVNNLEYGSYAPGAPNVFLDDSQFAQRWRSPQLYYLLVEGPALPRIQSLVGDSALHLVKQAGGKSLFANRPK
jgi:hypothetical protein